MRESDGYYVWNKNEVYPINKYFKTNEFSCQCKNPECVEQKASIELITRLTTLREQVQEPITITSGFRCEKHQAEVEASGVSTVVAKHSQHELGNAADIKPTRMQIDHFLQLSEKLFKAIGIAKTWLHVDLRDDKERRWYY